MVGRVSGTFGTVFFGGSGASVVGMLDVRCTGSRQQYDTSYALTGHDLTGFLPNSCKVKTVRVPHK